MKKKEWKKINKELNLTERLKGIFEKTSHVLEELQKREIAKGEKAKNLFINSQIEKKKMCRPKLSNKKQLSGLNDMATEIQQTLQETASA